MDKVRVEIDLLKPQLESVWVGLDDYKTGLWESFHKIEYKSIPKYWKHYILVRHSMDLYRVLEKKKAETLMSIKVNKDEQSKDQRKKGGNSTCAIPVEDNEIQ